MQGPSESELHPLSYVAETLSSTPIGLKPILAAVAQIRKSQGVLC